MKLARKLLKLIDYAALLIGLLGICAIIPVLGWVAVMQMAKAADEILSNKGDRIWVIVFVASLVWCVLRWEKLNEKD
jgi:hypothetical protein